MKGISAGLLAKSGNGLPESHEGYDAKVDGLRCWELAIYWQAIRMGSRRPASMLNVSERAVQRATVVRDHAIPELQEKVAKGEVAPSTAADVVRLFPAFQLSI